MPADAPALKIANTRALGAEVVLYDRPATTAMRSAQRSRAERGLALVPPFDDPEVIAGQGTTGLEIAEEAARWAYRRADVLVCCGGGGLTSGIALALEAGRRACASALCEPEGFDDMARSLAAGKILPNVTCEGGLCDAILTSAPGRLTFPILARLAGPGLAVTRRRGAARHGTGGAASETGCSSLAARWRWPRRCSGAKRSRALPSSPWRPAETSIRQC